MRERDATRRIPFTLLLAVGVATVAVGLWMAIDVSVAGWPWEKSRALTALAESIAAPKFRPSVVGSQAGFYGTALAARGVGLWEMLFGRWDWVLFTFRSFFGVYGRMNIFGPRWLYQTQFALALLLFATIVLACWNNSGGRGSIGFGISGIALAIVLSALHSWVSDLQAQGRYILVILPIAGVLLAEAGHTDSTWEWGSNEGRLAHMAIAALWVLGVVSFAFFGLPALVRA